MTRRCPFPCLGLGGLQSHQLRRLVPMYQGRRSPKLICLFIGDNDSEVGRPDTSPEKHAADVIMRAETFRRVMGADCIAVSCLSPRMTRGASYQPNDVYNSWGRQYNKALRMQLAEGRFMSVRVLNCRSQIPVFRRGRGMSWRPKEEDYVGSDRKRLIHFKPDGTAFQKLIDAITHADLVHFTSRHH